MTSRNIVSSHFPYLPIRAYGGGITYEGDALLDTGFSGGLVLPSVLLPEEGYAMGYDRLTLADNSQVVVPHFTGTIEIDGFQPFQTTVAIMGDEALVGVQVISRYYILLDHGERVVVSQ